MRAPPSLWRPPVAIAPDRPPTAASILRHSLQHHQRRSGTTRGRTRPVQVAYLAQHRTGRRRSCAAMSGSIPSTRPICMTCLYHAHLVPRSPSSSLGSVDAPPCRVPGAASSAPPEPSGFALRGHGDNGRGIRQRHTSPRSRSPRDIDEFTKSRARHTNGPASSRARTARSPQAPRLRPTPQPPRPTGNDFTQNVLVLSQLPPALAEPVDAKGTLRDADIHDAQVAPRGAPSTGTTFQQLRRRRLRPEA